jgi:cytochrome c oxidase cbb3-type subunit 1
MQAEAINPRLVKFIWAALIFFAWSLIMGALLSQESVRVFVEAGPGHIISVMHTHIGLMGWMTVALMAAVYYFVPIFSGKSIVNPKLIDWIFWIYVICSAVAAVLMIIAGVLGGNAFAAGVKGSELSAVILPYAMPGGILCTISALVGLIFVVQVLVSLSRPSK